MKTITTIINKKTSIKFFHLTILMITISCNKTANYSDIDLIVGKNWNLESRKVDEIEISDSCDLDDILYFENSSDFTYNLGTNICSQEILHKTEISWKLIDNFTIIRMKYKFSAGESKGIMVEYWEIIELSDTVLIVKDATAEDNNLVPEIRIYN